jgi:hypothetical protein
MVASVLAWLGGWLFGLLSDCLQAWCRQIILRRLGLEERERSTIPADTSAPLPPSNQPAQPEPLIHRLYQTVARFRQGDLL